MPALLANDAMEVTYFVTHLVTVCFIAGPALWASMSHVETPTCSNICRFDSPPATSGSLFLPVGVLPIARIAVSSVLTGAMSNDSAQVCGCFLASACIFVAASSAMTATLC